MTREERKKSLEGKSKELYDYIDELKKQVKFNESIIEYLEKQIDKAYEQITEINMSLDEFEESLLKE